MEFESEGQSELTHLIKQYWFYLDCNVFDIIRIHRNNCSSCNPAQSELSQKYLKCHFDNDS